jgi:hypothetical protein
LERFGGILENIRCWEDFCVKDRGVDVKWLAAIDVYSESGLVWKIGDAEGYPCKIAGFSME